MKLFEEDAAVLEEIASQYGEESVQYRALKHSAIALWWALTDGHDTFASYVTRFEGDLTPEQRAHLCMANCQIGRNLAKVDTIAAMRDFLILFVHLVVTVARLAGPGGLRSVVAESVLVRHQLLILNRGRKRAPNLHIADRIIAGLCTLFIRQAACSPFRYCFETFHSAAFPHRPEQTKVPHLVFTQTPVSTWPEGTGQRPH